MPTCCPMPFTPESGPAKKVFAICAEIYYILRTSVSGSAEESEGFVIGWLYYWLIEV